MVTPAPDSFPPRQKRDLMEARVLGRYFARRICSVAHPRLAGRKFALHGVGKVVGNTEIGTGTCRVARVHGTLRRGAQLGSGPLEVCVDENVRGVCVARTWQAVDTI